MPRQAKRFASEFDSRFAFGGFVCFRVLFLGV